MLSLIPPDSEIPPKVLSDMYDIDRSEYHNAEHASSILAGNQIIFTNVGSLFRLIFFLQIFPVR